MLFRGRYVATMWMVFDGLRLIVMFTIVPEETTVVGKYKSPATVIGGGEENPQISIIVYVR